MGSSNRWGVTARHPLDRFPERGAWAFGQVHTIFPPGDDSLLLYNDSGSGESLYLYAINYADRLTDIQVFPSTGILGTLHQRAFPLIIGMPQPPGAVYSWRYAGDPVKYVGSGNYYLGQFMIPGPGSGGDFYNNQNFTSQYPLAVIPPMKGLIFMSQGTDPFSLGFLYLHK